MKGTMANIHLSKLAAKGRGRDSEIARTSRGELWHFTQEEKFIIDELVRKIVKRQPFADDLVDFESDFSIDCTGDWHE